MPVLSTTLKISHQIATYETRLSHHSSITPEHFFCGITKLEDFAADDAVSQFGLSSEEGALYLVEVRRLLDILMRHKVEARHARRAMRQRIGRGNHVFADDDHIPRSDASRALFGRAAQLAEQAQTQTVGAQHLLAALLEDHTGKVRDLLQQMGGDVDGLCQALLAPHGNAFSTETPFLSKLGVDLVQLARDGKLMETIGRRDEMLQVLRSLARESKNNPVLVGDAGVGKTAIVEGIAVRIATGNVDPAFHDRRIVQINAADLVAGTKYRGEFEERLTHIIDEASASPHIILFIDEIHLLVGAGSVEGGMDAANILKPALARGQIKLIGATTDTEYRRIIERDAALERRFQPVRVDEPTPEETRNILLGIRERLQRHHKANILDEAIDAAIQLSVKYIASRRLPDKARDLLDEACSRVRFTQLSFHPALAGSDDAPAAGRQVTADTVREVVAEKVGVPIGQLDHDEAQRILNLADTLRERVIGQDEAVDAVAAAIRRNYADLRAGRRPIGVFLFVGPSGVGKTELAKATAHVLFGEEDRLIRIDMSEYIDRYSAARLIGAPPGYVGYEEGGQLTEGLHRTPYTVVLIDEIEKAHPDVLNIFLQVFGEGRLTDGQGRTIDASNGLFIMTSNIGFGLQMGLRTAAPDSHAIEAELRAQLRPEFLNRIDAIVHFSPLRPEHMVRLVQQQLGGLQGALDRRQVRLDVSAEAVAWLAEQGYDSRLGARPLIRLIETELVNPLGDLILAGHLVPGSFVTVSVSNDRIRLSTPTGAAADSPATQDLELRRCFKQAIEAVRQGNDNEALALFNRAVEIAPQSALPYFNRGYFHQTHQNPQQALADFTHAIELDGDYAPAYRRRGLLHFHRGDIPHALDDLNRALALDPSDIIAYVNRGTVYDALRRTDEALADFTKAIALDPDDAGIYYERAVCFRQAKRFDEALADYNTALRLEPAYVMAYVNRGMVYRLMGRHEDAVADCTRAIELGYSYPGIFTNRAAGYSALGQIEKSLEDLQRAHRLAPHEVSICMPLGFTLLDLERYEEALPLFEEAMRMGLFEAAQYVQHVREKLGVPDESPMLAAMDALMDIGSPAELQRVVPQFPFVTDPKFIDVGEKKVLGNLPPELASRFRQRLGWLKQAARGE